MLNLFSESPFIYLGLFILLLLVYRKGDMSAVFFLSKFYSSKPLHGRRKGSEDFKFSIRLCDDYFFYYQPSSDLKTKINFHSILRYYIFPYFRTLYTNPTLTSYVIYCFQLKVLLIDSFHSDFYLFYIFFMKNDIKVRTP